MSTIDFHCHILPEKIPDFKGMFGYGGFIQLNHQCGQCRADMVRDDGKFFRAVDSNLWDPKKRLEECDRHGVQMQVLSTVPVMFSYWAKPQHTLEVAKFLNDHLAETVESAPQRFRGLATLPMQDPDLACQELERCINTLGLSGIQIGTHIGDWNLNHPQVEQVLACAAELGAVVFVHPWDMMGQPQMPDYWLPWLVGMPAETSLAMCSLIFSGMFLRYPKLKVVFAHGGGSFPGTLGRIQHGFEVRPDLCAKDCEVSPRDQIGRFWVDSLVHDDQALEHNCKLFGSDRIVTGSDYPFPLGEAVAGKAVIENSSLSTEQKQQILYKNAAELLNL